MSGADLHPAQLAEPTSEAPLVSPNNPCPFLRALVEGGHLSGHVERLATIAETIVAAGGATPNEPQVPKYKVYLIAMVANGLGLMRLARSVREGAQLDALRGGPLDKRGVGSRVLDAAGCINETELARLDQFAADKVDSSGVVERGLGIDQLHAMMDANFARAVGRRRRIDRALMQGEWPILLRVMGKTSAGDRYLSLTELHVLFVERRLPPRITQRLECPEALSAGG